MPATEDKELQQNLERHAQRLSRMHEEIDCFERRNDWLGNREVRHAISQRLVEIRILLRDGKLKK